MTTSEEKPCRKGKEKVELIFINQKALIYLCTVFITRVGNAMAPIPLLALESKVILEIKIYFLSKAYIRQK